MISPVTAESLKGHWWAFLLRGIVALIFAAACFFLTGATIFVLVLWIGAFFFVDGILMIVGAIRAASGSHHTHWWWQILGGLVGIAAGVLTWIWPGITALTLAIFVGAWAFVTGIFELATAIRMRSALPNEWLWIVNGVLSILLGIFIAIFPGAGLVAFTWMLGFYALLAGIAMIALGFRLRSA